MAILQLTLHIILHNLTSTDRISSFPVISVKNISFKKLLSIKNLISSKSIPCNHWIIFNIQDILRNTLVITLKRKHNRGSAYNVSLFLVCWSHFHFDVGLCFFLSRNMQPRKITGFFFRKTVTTLLKNYTPQPMYYSIL